MIIRRYLQWCQKEGLQPWWRFWHPMSGLRGGMVAGLIVGLIIYGMGL